MEEGDDIDDEGLVVSEDNDNESGEELGGGGD